MTIKYRKIFAWFGIALCFGTMERVFGLETEYGITLDGAESVDVVAESIALVRSYTEHGALMKWDYGHEDPHRDARGFRAKELRQDADESAYYEIDKNRPLTFQEIKSDLVLSNGARFYNDHAHPEYSTPECTTLCEIVAQEKAGERILAECARRRNAHLSDGEHVRLYKNNTVSIDTMNRRPLVNTRDEPHADANKYRRFHVIVGDSNMSEWATAMKLGTTALVLDLIERGKAPQLEIAQPIDAAKSISRDQNYDWIIELRDGRKISAIDVQRLYLSAAQKVERDKEERGWILGEWEGVLNDLERDVMLCRDRVDWAAKKFLLNELQEEEKLQWSDPWLQAIDLEYHNIDLERGLYYELLRQGSMRRVVSEDEIRHAIFSPPETTRAFFRGRAVARFTDQIESIQWNEIVLSGAGHSQRIALPEPADESLKRLNAAMRESANFADFLRALGS